MAKGDSGRAQDMINQQRPFIQENSSNIQNTIGNQRLGVNLDYNNAINRNFGSYDEIMQGYRNFLGGPSDGGGGGGYTPQTIGLDQHYKGFLDRGLAGYEDFSKTGGFTDQNIQDMRARAIAPTRAIYQNAQGNIDRQRRIQGGYSPNYTAATAKLTRDASQEIADANINTNASLAGLIQQGRLAGLGGMQSGSLAGMDRQLGVDQFNASAANSAAAQAAAQAGQGRQYDLAALRGMTDLYGTNPGLTNVLGSQSLGLNQQFLNAGQMNNQNRFNLINSQINKSQIPGDFAQGMGNVGSVLGGIGGLFTGIGAL